MPKRKVIVEVDINDDRINSIEDLEQEILAQDIYAQIAKKYLDGLQDDMAQHMNAIKGIKIPDNNNHVENLMGIVGQKVKKNRQSWVDANLDIMMNTIWQIIS